jgi:putative ABC transport system permease protein
MFRTPGRFIALFLIIVLGASFFTGLQASSPSMEATADAYFDRSQMADFRLLCSMGITDEDVTAVAALPSVVEATPGYRVDVKASHNETAEAAYAIHSLPADLTGPAVTGGTDAEAGTVADGSERMIASGVSRLTLTAGRLPTAPNECIADAKAAVKIGDTYTLSKENEKTKLELFPEQSLTVVGLAWSPVYISPDRGNTNIGSGSIFNYIYVLPSAFESEYYTEINLRLKETDSLSAFSKEYETLIDRETAALKPFLQSRADKRREDILREAEAELAEAEAEYAKKKKTTQSELDDALAKLDSGRASIAQGQQSYQQNVNALANARTKLKNAKSELAQARKTLDQKKKELTKAKGELAKGVSALSTLQAQLNSLKSALAVATDPVTVATLQAQINAVSPQVSALSKQVKKGKKDVAAAEKKIKEGEASYTAGQKEITASEKKIQQSEAKLKTAQNQLNSGRASLATNQKKYDSESKKATESFREAQKEIDEAKEKLDDLETSEWFIQTREDLPGYSELSSNVTRIRNLSLIVPWFFFLVAALVCLTTMTRLVEEHRTRIGVLKALGYRRRTIMGRYQFYAWAIGIFGGAIGVVVGLYGFPRAIWTIYGNLYNMGDFQLSVPMTPCIIGLLGGTVAISIATATVCQNALKSSAAALMRPKAPKPGKRVLLERIPFLWNLFSFSQKVTLRNLFRYKNRFVMTIIGVAGCTALLVTGFGIRDSIGGMMDLQFNKVTPARAEIFLDESSSATADTPLNRLLTESRCVIGYFHYTTVSASTKERNNKNLNTYLTIPENPANIMRFTNLRERGSNTPIPFPPDESKGPAAIISEQLANTLDLSVGDRFSFGMVGEDEKEVRVAAITENYVLNFIYITPASYEALFGEAPTYATIMLNTDISEEQLDKLLNQVYEDESVTSLYSVGPVRATMAEVVASLDGVVALMLLIAAMLAFIVLYNLTNINITERERELATLKVLGFYPREVTSYISRETTILTIIGAGIGLFGGTFLHRYVITSVEVSNLMFPQIIFPQSYAYAAAFTLLCSFFIGLCMRPRLKRIDPVGSLKSVE